MTRTHSRRYFATLLSLLVMAALLISAGCATGNEGGTSSEDASEKVGKTVVTDKGQYRDISPDELKAMMDKKDFFLVDVHVPNEGKMPQLDARIPYDKITEQLDKLPADKKAKIVLTCRSGRMSTEASRGLADLGYTGVYNLVGGFNAWKEKGYAFTPEP